MALMDEVAQKRAEYFRNKKQEALGQVNAQKQEGQDVLQRRFSSLGAQGSGAQIDAEQKLRESSAAQARQAQNDLVGQELQAGEADIGRAFQAEQAKLAQQYGTQERLGSQEFSGQQSQLGREYGTQERLGSQTYASEQAKLGREFTVSERLAQQVYGSDEAGKTRQFQAGQQLLQNEFAKLEASTGRAFTADQQKMQNDFVSGQSEASRTLQSKLAADELQLKKSIADMQNAKDQQTYELAKKQFDIDKETTDFNKIISLVMAGIPFTEARVSVSGGTPSAQGAAPVTSSQGATQAFINQEQTAQNKKQSDYAAAMQRLADAEKNNTYR